MAKDCFLIIGAAGQLGTEITAELRARHGESQVIASDTMPTAPENLAGGIYESLNVLDPQRLGQLVSQYKVTQIYHLAALLSARAEQQPNLAWQVNIQGYMNVLDVAKADSNSIAKVYFPSSIAAFGPTTPKTMTPQQTVMEPNTVYGITKQVGERLSQYYFEKFGVDVRSLRYPGIISYKTPPGGGTTDYAVDIYHHAVQGKHYNCFLKPDTELPMMYMPDALRATFELMEAPADRIKQRGSYNLAAISFTPETQAESIRKEMPSFSISYAPDFRQAIADSWPGSIDDSAARDDWGWSHRYDLQAMTQDMLYNLKDYYQNQLVSVVK